jgi:hypothetical protein
MAGGSAARFAPIPADFLINPTPKLKAKTVCATVAIAAYIIPSLPKTAITIGNPKYVTLGNAIENCQT